LLRKQRKTLGGYLILLHTVVASVDGALYVCQCLTLSLHAGVLCRQGKSGYIRSTSTIVQRWGLNCTGVKWAIALLHSPTSLMISRYSNQLIITHQGHHYHKYFNVG